jgi:hypothetical protein
MSSHQVDPSLVHDESPTTLSDQYGFLPPPWPRFPPHHRSILSFAQFQGHGLEQAASSSSNLRQCHYDLARSILVKLDQGMLQGVAAAQSETTLVNRNGLSVVREKEAWLIGHASAVWEEPHGTTISDYDLRVVRRRARTWLTLQIDTPI